jgi:hypothetical protein
MPPWLDEELRRAVRDGVFFRMTHPTPGERMRTTEIHWKPGDPNALAEAIIKKVSDDGWMTLELDGHRYLIRKEPP